MRRISRAALFALLALMGQRTSGPFAQEKPDTPAPVPVEREPRHRPVFANEALRVIRLAMPLNDTSLFHTHTHDNLTVRIAGESRNQTIGSDWGEAAKRPPGSVAVAEYVGRTAPAHRVQNVGTLPFLQIVVENLRSDGWSTPAPITAPGMSLVQENRAFRAYRATLTSHVTTSHQHSVPTVVVLVSGEAETGSGRSASLSAPGEWALIPSNVPHTLGHKGTMPTEVVEVEVR